MEKKLIHITALHTAKLRATPTRLAVLKVLQNTRHPLSVEGIHKKVRGADLVTVYRTLESFESAGIAARVSIGDGIVRFERKLPHHHHLVCAHCGTVEDIVGGPLQEVEKSLQKVSRRFKSIYAHDLEFFGMCETCVH
ncbi:transcriptional repressor [Acetobacteraceae bacterium]|nr:transcriptional repressor [Candidatus Parcubacteria bacterium]